MISTTKLVFNYPSAESIHFDDMEIASREVCLLLGESGSGKTTLLHLLGGLLRSYNGSLKVDSRELKAMPEKEIDLFRGNHYGFVFQKNHLIHALTVEKNVLLSFYLAHLPIDMERMKEVLDSLGLYDKRKSRVTQLSYGQAQRVAIARAIVHRPSIIIADEPTSALDDQNCHKVMELLLQVASQNESTLIVATHDQRLKGIIKKQIHLHYAMR